MLRLGPRRVGLLVGVVEPIGDEVLADELRAWCKERLRRYEYPHIVTFVDSLPRTLTGKVQRFLLREWAMETAPAQPAATPAESEPPAKTL